MGEQSRSHLIQELEERKKVFNAGSSKSGKISIIIGAGCLVLLVIIGIIIGQVVAGIIVGIIIGAGVAIVKYNIDLKKLDSGIEK